MDRNRTCHIDPDRSVLLESGCVYGAWPCDSDGHSDGKDVSGKLASNQGQYGRATDSCTG